MNSVPRGAALAILVAACWVPPLSGQEIPPPAAPLPPGVAERLQRLEERFNQMDQHYQEELKRRDNEIAALKSQIATSQASAPAGAERAAATRAITQDILDDQARRNAALDRAVSGLTLSPNSSSGALLSAPVGNAQLRLIDLSLDVLMAGGGSTVNDAALANLQGGGHDPRKNGFTLQNVELSISGAVDPFINGEAHIVYIIDPATGETGVELEEAFLTTQQLPYNLQLKAGHYFTEFGRLNPRHPHQWAWLDQPVINSRLFGPDGMRGTGARLSWLAPLPWYSELYAGLQNANGETMASFLSSDELFEERPIGGLPFVEQTGSAFDSLVYSARWENGADLNEQWNAAIGLSGLYGPNATGSGSRTFVYGADLTVKWRPPHARRGSPGFIWQTEVMGRCYETALYDDGETTIPGSSLEDWGLYTQGLYGFAPGWRGGLRLEYASASGDSIGGRSNDPFRDTRYRVSPLVEWQPSEFSRFRMQMNYDRADHLADKEAFTFWLGMEFFLGAHAAHRY